MLTPILWVLLFRVGLVRGQSGLRVVDAETQTMEEQRRRFEQLDKRNFEQRFKKLAEELQHFANEYNKGRGTVWPRKQAEALRKACRELERSTFLKGTQAGTHQSR